MMKAIISMIVVLFCVACSPKLDVMYKIPKTDAVQSSNIFMIRDSMDFATFYPTIDDKTVAGLSNGEYVQFSIAEGKHEFRNMLPYDGHTNAFTMVLFGGTWAHWRKANIVLHTEWNKDYYFLLTSEFGQIPKIELLNTKRGLELVHESNRIPTGTISGDSDLDVEVLDMPRLVEK